MIDIEIIRKNSKIVKDSLKKRGEKEKLKLIDNINKKDKEWRILKSKLDNLRHKRNLVSKKINLLKKENKSFKKELKEAKEIPKKIENIENKVNKLRKEIKANLLEIPNILDKTVPMGKDERDNKEIRKYGKIKKIKVRNHAELLEKLKLGNFEKASKIAGTGFNYLIDKIALLDQALIRFTIDNLVKKGYTLIETPLMLRREAYEGAAPLKDFEEMIYKIENENLYLIATSEHSMAVFLKDENIKELPLRFISISPCFRKELGSHGVDQKGLFRVHQFYKVEQFIFCKKEDSYKLQEELLKNMEEIIRKLELPYRIVLICSGETGRFASKQYDIEIWSPRQGKYTEEGSCSNCTDYQARRLNIKCNKEFVHTLNSTAVATSRVLVGILENFQEKDTVKVPKVLWKYTGFKKIG